jgi:hypothetical protein
VVDREPEYRRVACEVVAQTDKAVLVQVAGVEHWLPLSQLDPEQDVPEIGNLGVVYVQEWVADDRGLPECTSEEDDELGPDIITRKRPAVAVLRRVSHPKFGLGNLLSVAGDKSVVAFDDHVTRTILSRFITAC